MLQPFQRATNVMGPLCDRRVNTAGSSLSPCKLRPRLIITVNTIKLQKRKYSGGSPLDII
jgi:hypothetical protein